MKNISLPDNVRCVVGMKEDGELKLLILTNEIRPSIKAKTLEFIIWYESPTSEEWMSLYPMLAMKGFWYEK